MTNLHLADEEWRQKLTAVQFDVCRQKGTERAFSGLYIDCKDPGVYHCVCCGQPLFDAESKYNSGSGWPSFWAVLQNDSVSQHTDESHGMKRVEVTCAACDAHLGHLFDDGPQPTGLRYCINSVCLELKEK